MPRIFAKSIFSLHLKDEDDACESSFEERPQRWPEMHLKPNNRLPILNGIWRSKGETIGMEEAQKIADALLGVIRLMVDEPEAISMIIRLDPPDETAIHLSVSAADAGKVIGKEGRTAKCLRIIVLTIAKKAKRRITLHFDPVE